MPFRLFARFLGRRPFVQPFESQLGDSTKLGQRRSFRERQLGGSTKHGLPKGVAEKLSSSPLAHSLRTASPEDSPIPKGALFGGGCQT